MTLIEALTILSVHNSWRHGDEGAPETHPASLTQAIDLIGEKVPQMIYALHEAREELSRHPCRPDALDYMMPHWENNDEPPTHHPTPTTRSTDNRDGDALLAPRA